MKTRPPHKIALSGKSGAGKTTVAQYLRDEYGFHVISTGSLCRELCKKHLGREDQQTLHGVAALVRDLSPSFWIEWALRQGRLDSPVVLDSIRFRSDVQYVRDGGYAIWRIDAEQEVRRRRLAARGQRFIAGRDESHAVETDLDDVDPDLRIPNSTDLDELFTNVRKALASLAVDCAG